MQDEKDQPIEDDFLDEDLEVFEDEDLSDVEALDDIADDDWDSLEDDEFEDVDLDDEPVAAQKPSFVKKYFNFIVIGVVAVGGGLFALGQLGGESSQQSQPAPSVEAQSYEGAAPDVAVTELAPNPIPVETSNNDIESANLSEASTDVLTPFPGEGASGSDLSLEPLDGLTDDLVVENEDTIADQPVLEPVAAVDSGASVDESTSLFGEPVLQGHAQDQEVLEEPVMLTDISLQGEAEAEEALPQIAEDVVDVPEVVSGLPDISAEEEAVLDISSDPAPQDITGDDGQSAEVETLKNENARLLVENQEKTKALEVARSDILTLESRLADLKAEIAALQVEKSEQKASEVAAVPEAEKPVQQEKAEPAVPEKSSTSAVSAAPKKVIKSAPVQWVLRSVSQGRASISQKGQGDFRTVEVGDRVPGLGKIQAIEKKNGRWIVRGTAGQVSQ